VRDISQGSVVTHLRCGGIYGNEFIYCWATQWDKFESRSLMKLQATL